MPEHPSKHCLLLKFEDYLENKTSIDKEESYEDIGGKTYSCTTLEYCAIQKAYNFYRLC